MANILGIDIGTTNIEFALFDYFYISFVSLLFTSDSFSSWYIFI